MAEQERKDQAINVKVKGALKSRILEAINKEIEKGGESGGPSPATLYSKNNFLSGYGKT
jgi:hypothetical protein